MTDASNSFAECAATTKGLEPLFRLHSPVRHHTVAFNMELQMNSPLEKEAWLVHNLKK